MTVYVQGHGPALLLVHSINAAASAAEMRPLHERAATTHTVFTPDLPGYGLSDRSDRPYSFSADIHSVYDALTPPVWVAHGDRGDFTDYRGLAPFAAKPNWRVMPLRAGALPHFEACCGYLEAFDRWLSAPPR